jgi:RNA polymerase sigma-70 factor (ECF subfamily)
MGLTEEARLVGLARRGVASAFDELFRRHSRRVHDLAYHMLGDRDAADDVVQEVFLRVHRRLGGFRGECSLRGWILRITVNECVSQRRRASRRRRRLPETVPPAAPCERVAEFAEAARQALETLRPVDRALVILRDIEGHTYEEIAEVLRCSSNSVGVRLHRARKRLRGELGRLLPEEEGR